MSELKPNIVLLGGGGHCVSVIDVIEQENKYNILGILEPNAKEEKVLGYSILGGDDLISKLVGDNTYFIITVGQIKSYSIREKLANILEKEKAKLAKVISPFAYVSKHSEVGKGTIIMHNAFVNADAKIGSNCIINTKVNIEHGARVEDFCHISTCSVVNGDSVVKRGTFVGSNATISHGVVVEKNSVIGAGKFIK